MLHSWLHATEIFHYYFFFFCDFIFSIERHYLAERKPDFINRGPLRLKSNWKCFSFMESQYLALRNLKSLQWYPIDCFLCFLL